METQLEKKITANDTIVAMLHNINSDKKELFYKAAEDYLWTLARNGSFHHRIKRLIEEKPQRFVQLENLSNDIKKLITPSIVTDNENVFLNDSTKTLLDELILEWKNADVYKYHNLGIRNKLLLHGTTGNGKTTIAKYIAQLAKLPFVEINSDTIVDSHIGNSGNNIWKIFNQINQPCVLFWDEVDTIGRKRGSSDSAAGMENERMVNSILVNIEKMKNEVIFIGATNRREILDSAFLRRFDVQFELTAPDSSEKVRFAKQMIEYYKLPEHFLGNLDQYNSYSEIKMMFMDLARKFVLSEISKGDNK